MLYLIVAHDGTDPQAQARRAAVRPAHLVGAKQRAEAGLMPLGGAILNAAGEMVGSALVVEAEDEAEARSIVENDPYTESGVWIRYDIWPFRRAF